ncbi:ATP-grasp domain-containing protein [Salinibius halmophilus]|uniref:ATP-grasp domain-containing protein n=1 Tax=Salinibius halmophilus TaxID=1853216 RepID=UPI000E665612|nr:hypothetical protein [Salinibius halmophilus]
MKKVSFNALRTLKLSGVTAIKPESFQTELDRIDAAEWLLFPEYWQLPTLIYGTKKKVFPSPASYFLGHDKVQQTRAFETFFPAHVPLTLIRPNTASAIEEILDVMMYPFVAKTAKASMGYGVFKINNRSEFDDYCAKHDVLYVQELLPIDRDLRIIVIGDKALGGYWRKASEHGFHNNISQGGEIITGEVSEQALALAERVARHFGIDHAGFDIAMVGEHPYLFEFNRLFGNQGLEVAGIDVDAAIEEYLAQRSEPTVEQLWPYPPTDLAS